MVFLWFKLSVEEDWYADFSRDLVLFGAMWELVGFWWSDLVSRMVSSFLILDESSSSEVNLKFVNILLYYFNLYVQSILTYYESLRQYIH